MFAIFFSVCFLHSPLRCGHLWYAFFTLFFGKILFVLIVISWSLMHVVLLCIYNVREHVVFTCIYVRDLFGRCKYLFFSIKEYLKKWTLRIRTIILYFLSNECILIQWIISDLMNNFEQRFVYSNLLMTRFLESTCYWHHKDLIFFTNITQTKTLTNSLKLQKKTSKFCLNV